jgi:transcriptional regulator with XRE-family HTH domain
MFETLGPALRVLREISGSSQMEIAKKAQVGKSQLSQYERGKQLPTLEPLGRIIAALETTPIVLFYVSSVLERVPQVSGGLRAELLEQGIETILRSRESRHYREMFDRFLALFETAVEARVLEAVARGRGEEAP